MPSALARLLLSFLPGRAIPNLLGVSHTARRLCACLHELDLSSCEELGNMRFVSSLVRLRTLDLSNCSEQLVDLSPLSSLTSLTSLNLHHRCGQQSNVSILSTLTSLASLNLSIVLLSAAQFISSIVPHRLDQLGPGLVWSAEQLALSSLSSLDQRCYISDLTPLSHLTSLTSLNLSECRHLRNVSPLSSLTSLTSLNLRYCLQVNDVSALSSFSQLTILR